MSRLIRIDDFPHGDKTLFYASHNKDYKARVEYALMPFEEHGIDYILGVSPGILNDGDIDFLLDNVKTGRVVLHGYTHGWEREWGRITDCWREGGEFEGQSIEEIKDNYWKGYDELKGLPSFDPEHYIPPFNCYSQNFLDAIKDTPVVYIHTCDKEYDSYGLKELNTHGKKVVISKYRSTYDYAHAVTNRINDKSQICLHWIYDSIGRNLYEDYKTLALEIKKMKEELNEKLK